MIERKAHFDVIRTAAGYHVRFVAANHRVVMTSEVYTTKKSAHKGIEAITGESLRKSVLTGHYKALNGHGFIEVRDVDER